MLRILNTLSNIKTFFATIYFFKSVQFLTIYFLYLCLNLNCIEICWLRLTFEIIGREKTLIALANDGNNNLNEERGCSYHVF